MGSYKLCRFPESARNRAFINQWFSHPIWEWQPVHSQIIPEIPTRSTTRNASSDLTAAIRPQQSFDTSLRYGCFSIQKRRSGLAHRTAVDVVKAVAHRLDGYTASALVHGGSVTTVPRP